MQDCAAAAGRQPAVDNENDGDCQWDVAYIVLTALRQEFLRRVDVLAPIISPDTFAPPLSLCKVCNDQPAESTFYSYISFEICFGSVCAA